MKQPPEKIEECRFDGPPRSCSGRFVIRHGNATLRLQISDGGGWDHVSVSLATRCPTWDEMCWVKRLLFDPEDVVMQLHPAESDYRNIHPYCLHLWRPQTAEDIARVRREWGDEWEYGDLQPQGTIPLPPSEMV